MKKSIISQAGIVGSFLGKIFERILRGILEGVYTKILGGVLKEFLTSPVK